MTEEQAAAIISNLNGILIALYALIAVTIVMNATRK